MYTNIQHYVCNAMFKGGFAISFVHYCLRRKFLTHVVIYGCGGYEVIFMTESTKIIYAGILNQNASNS